MVPLPARRSIKNENNQCGLADNSRHRGDRVRPHIRAVSNETAAKKNGGQRK
jgi:hypothetical protein